MSSVSDAYDKAINLFQDKKRFSKGYYQRTARGKECKIVEGYSFCALGAVQYFTYDLDDKRIGHKAWCCLQRVSEHLYGQVIQTINDGWDGRRKVIKALEFARDLWKDHEPTEEHCSMKIPELLLERKAK